MPRYIPKLKHRIVIVHYPGDDEEALVQWLDEHILNMAWVRVEFRFPDEMDCKASIELKRPELVYENTENHFETEVDWFILQERSGSTTPDIRRFWITDSMFRSRLAQLFTETWRERIRYRNAKAV